MCNSRRGSLLDVLLTTTALVAALAGGGKGAEAAGSSSGLSGFQVQSGGATLSTPSATKSVITQSTNKAIISWSAFGIPTGSTVQFIQPGSSSVALNRVTGGNVTNILGHLTANGQVWIVNPAGVFFGAGAQVDVAGLMATTSDIQNGNFLGGTYQFGIGSQNPNAGIVNQGTIRVASGGSAVLSGAQVTNQGLIEAQLGSVVLAGAKTFTVDFQGDKLLSFQVTGAVDQRPNEASGAPANALVTNSGTVSASGGTVLITARAAKNIIDNVINSTGIVEAQSAQLVNGEIVLDGGDTGAVTVSGSLDASGKSAGETGGTVKVLGDQVQLASGAKVDVSGDAGGGTALIGGNFHGAGPEQNASVTVISANATINADAISSGNGGNVAVWSEQYTDFYGTITARGGTLSGNGGFVETSSRGILHAFGTVNVGGPQGTAGTWLLDPANVTIEANSGTVTSGTFSNGTFTPGLGATDSIIDPSVINTALANGGTVLINANGNTAISAGNILIDANLTLSGNKTASSLIFSAGATSGSITLGANDTISVTGNTDTLAINFVAGAAGSIAMATGSALVVQPPEQAQNPSSINASFSAGAGNSIFLANNTTIATDGGNVSFNRPVVLGSAGTAGTVIIDTTEMQHTAFGGSVDFGSTVDAAATAEVSLAVGGGTGGTVTFGGSVGARTPLAGLTVTSAATLTSSAVLNAGTGTLSVGVINAGGNDLTLEGDTISLTGGTGSISGSGSLTIEPFSQGAENVLFGGTTAPGAGTLFVSSTSLAVLSGFSSETFGPSAGSGTLTINASGTFLSSTTFIEGPTGVIVLSTPLAGGSGAGLTLQAGTVDLNSNVTTSNAPIVVTGGAVLGANATLSSGGGNITVTGANTINSAAGTAFTLSIAPGSGDVILGGAIGGSTPLGALLVSGTGTTTLSGGTITTTTANSASGSISFSEGVLLAGAETLTSQGGNISFGGAINGGFGVSLSADSGIVSLHDVGATTAVASLSIDPAGIVLGGTTYHTTGSQTYAADVTLGANVSLTSDSGNIEFLNGIDGAHAFSAQAALGTVSLHDAGDTTALSSVTVGASSIELSGTTLHSSGSQSFSGPVLLTGNETLTSDAGSVTFTGTVNGPQALSVTAASGSIGIGGLIGGGTALSNLSLDGESVVLSNIGSAASDGVIGAVSITGITAIDLAGSVYHSGGSQSFTGPVVLQNDETVISDTGGITFSGTVDGAHGLTATATGLTTFDGAIGSGTALTSLTVTNAADLNGGSIASTGAQNYDGAVILSADALLTGSAITFFGTVDGAHGLTATATGLTTFDGAVGSGTALASLTVTNAADVNGGSIATTGAQNYDGSVTLSSNALLTGGAITFLGTVDGAHGLTATATGLTTFDGAVGSGTALTSLTVTNAADLNGSSITTTGAQNYDGAVTLSSNALLTGTAITFLSTVDGAHGLTATATGLTTFEGAVGSGTALSSLTVTNAADLNGGNITTTGAQNYDGAVILSADALLTGSAITFFSTVDGAHGLTATATGLTTFDAAVGSGTALTSLTVTNGADLNGGSIKTTGAQNYDGAVTLSANALLTGGAITFFGTVDGAHGLTATATGFTTFDGAVGSGTALTSLTVTNGADLNGGSITTTGAQNYDGLVILSSDALLTGSAITFFSTVDGAHGLTATATGLTTFDAAVGSGTALASLTVTNGADLNGGSIKTTGAQNYDGAVTLSADALLTGGTITFQKAVDGAHGLTATATGLTTFDAAVGSGTALTSLTVTNGADLNGGSIKTTGAQNYDGAVTLSADALLTGTTITFASTVDGAHGLTATATGLTTFDGAVGSGTALSSLTVTNAADLNGGSIKTTGAQNYDGAVTLSADALLTGTAITFFSTVDGAHGLTATATGLTTFDAAVGSGTALASLTVTNTADLNGGSITTTGAQNYDGPVTLSANATLTSVGGNVIFGSTIDGGDALSVAATSGSIAFDGLIGGTSPLTSLTANATTVTLSGIGTPGTAGVTGAVSITGNGLIAVNGATYHSGGSESFTGPVLLAGDATVISNTGNVTFTGTIDGAHALFVTASTGSVGVGGVIGGETALTAVVMNGHSGVSLTSALTDGAQSYTSAQTIALGGLYDTGDGSFTATGVVQLTGATTFNPGSGSLSVSGALTGSANLAVLGSAGATFASINLGNTGTIDLSGKTAGSFTVNGPTDAAALTTGTNPYSLALLGGGTIGDPTLANTGGDTLAGSFVFSGGLTVPGTLTLGGAAVVNEETSGITLGTVNQGNNVFVVIADSVSLNGPWNGTGPRGITPFSNKTISLNDGPNGWVLTNSELQILADPPSFVVIGGGTAITQEILNILEHKPIFVPKGAPGPLDVGTFTFNAPLILIGSSISIDGTLSQTSGGVGFITPGSINGLGSLDLGPGTGILAVAAGSADIHGTIDGTTGGAAAQDVVLIVPASTGTFKVNNACFADCGNTLAGLGSLVLFSNQLDGSQAGLASGLIEAEGGGANLANISPSAGSGDDNTPTDQAVSALGGPLNSKPPTQAQPRMQGYYVSLLGGMLYVWRDLPSGQQGNTSPEENTDFSGWGNEANW